MEQFIADLKRKAWDSELPFSLKWFGGFLLAVASSAFLLAAKSTVDALLEIDVVIQGSTVLMFILLWTVCTSVPEGIFETVYRIGLRRREHLIIHLRYATFFKVLEASH